ncbi:MAG: extracellular solute-binding protein [Acidimicrobiales bacterium]
MNKFIRGRTAKSIRLVVAFTAVAFGGSILAITGPSSAAPKAKSVVTLQYWNTYNQKDAEGRTMSNIIIPRFEKLNPGIKVVSTYVVYADLLPKFIATSAAGDPPDVLRSDIAWVAQLAQQGLAVNVGKLKAFASIKSAALPGPLATTEVNGKYWAFPCDTNTQALYWNKALFAAAGISGPPTTIDQLLSDAATLTVPSKQQYGLGVDGTDIWNMAPYIWSMGGSFTNANYTTASGYMDSPATATAVTTLVNLLKAGDIGSDFQGGASAVSGETGFPKNEYAMYIDGPWAVPTYLGESFSDYGIAPFPSGSAGSISTVGGEDNLVATDGHHVSDAEKFAEFLDSPFAQLEMAKQGDMSAMKNDAAQEVKNTPYYSVFTKQLLTARIRANSPGYSQLDADWSNELGQILSGSVSVSAGLQTAAQEADTALAGS